MHSYIHKVQYYETDQMQVAHHSNYIRWMEEARVDWLKAVGWSYDRLESLGIFSPVTAVDCRFVTSTTFAETVSVALSPESFNGVTLRIAYEMRRADGTVCCTGHTEHCFLNKDGRFLRLKRDFPDFHAMLMAHLPDTEAAQP